MAEVFINILKPGQEGFLSRLANANTPVVTVHGLVGAGVVVMYGGKLWHEQLILDIERR